MMTPRSMDQLLSIQENKAASKAYACCGREPLAERRRPDRLLTALFSALPTACALFGIAYD
eukprot:scaffold314896_cov30-Tisochrysis_lutea.AAC.2